MGIINNVKGLLNEGDNYYISQSLAAFFMARIQRIQIMTTRVFICPALIIFIAMKIQRYHCIFWRPKFKK
jgi:hypothetical protein